MNDLGMEAARAASNSSILLRALGGTCGYSTFGRHQMFKTREPCSPCTGWTGSIGLPR